MALTVCPLPVCMAAIGGWWVLVVRMPDGLFESVSVCNLVNEFRPAIRSVSRRVALYCELANLISPDDEQVAVNKDTVA